MLMIGLVMKIFVTCTYTIMAESFTIVMRGTFPVIYRCTQSWARDSFSDPLQRQRDNVIEPQGPEKIRKIFRSRWQDGVATTNVVMLQ